MARGGADGPALPVELWGHVASLLTMRESCMLASTCRALWAMDLVSVAVLTWEKTWNGIYRRNCPAPVLAWAAKRWSRAQLLKIDIMQDNTKELSQALACCTADDLACLEEVPVASRYNMDFVGNLVLVVNQAHTHAPPPQILCANVGRLSGFVGVRGIKHLVLLTRNPQCSHLSSAIAGLEHLETLLLGHATGERLQQQTSGALQLAAHPSLQSLKLACIVPESISCSDSCELHVELGDIWSMEHPVWDTVLPHLRSVTLFGYSADLVAMPSMLLRADNLFKADLMAERCGMANAPLLLGGSLAHVEELILDCVELHAIVPARVTWRNVYVAATHLDLHFKDVASFGEVIPAFCFRFKELQGTEILELGIVVAKRNPEWTGALRIDDNASDSTYQPLTSGMCFPTAQPPNRMWEAEKRCCCGACVFCLGEAGIMH